MFIPEDKLKTLDEYRAWVQGMRLLIDFINALEHLSDPSKELEWTVPDWIPKKYSVWVWLQRAQDGI